MGRRTAELLLLLVSFCVCVCVCSCCSFVVKFCVCIVSKCVLVTSLFIEGFNLHLNVIYFFLATFTSKY